ncbi:MAG TPA: BTAD domain-containing putative transcriptional regulator [Ktedonobacterales bacterium]
MITTPALVVRALGDFNLLRDGEQAPGLSNPRMRALLIYLALHRDAAQQRAHIAFLFWPDVTESQARNNLRQTLHQLRQVCPEIEGLLSIDARALQWRPRVPCRLDIAEFEQAVARAGDAALRSDPSSLRAALEEADRLYTGDLLPDCFDDWIQPERMRLRQLHTQAMERLMRLQEAQGDARDAIHSAQRLLAMDPISEDRYRQLMRLYALNHERASALHVYHTCVSVLQRELGVVPSAATREAYERLLAQEALEEVAIEPPIGATEPPPGRIPPPASRPLLPAATPALTGREREWERLRGAWLHATEIGPHFALLTGEAGVGKSRLAEDFLLWAGQQGGVTAKARSYAAEGLLAMAPVTDWLRSDGLRKPLRRLDDVWLTEIVRLLPEVLSERPELPRYEPMSEYGQRQRFFEALARAVLIAPQPIALLLDDMQWLDQESLAWLHLLLRFEPTARLLIVGCARQEELSPQHPLRAFVLQLRRETAVTEIPIEPLDAAETTYLASRVANRQLDMSEGLRLFHESGGYPLFVVEMMRAGPERAAQPSNRTSSPFQPAPPNEAQSLPPLVHAVLAGRLMQLSPAARVFAEQAATIGRAFTLDLLSATSDASAESDARALDELWQKRIVREHGANTYDFTHDKLRDVAYSEIGAPQRRLLHRRVAQALEAQHASELDVVSGELASHYERAGMIEQAIPYYRRAAAAAQALWANEESISLLVHGLDLLGALPASAKRDRQELELQVALAPLYRMTRGWTAPELERALDRALALCDTVGDDRSRGLTLFGMTSLYVTQARLDRVPLVYDEMASVFQRALGSPPPPFAGIMLASANLHMGKIAESSAQLAEFLTTRDANGITQFEESQGTNYTALATALRSLCLWLLGYPQQALDCGLEAIRMAREAGQPFNQALTSTYFSLLQQLRASESVAQTHAEQALALATTYQAPYYRNWADIMACYAQAAHNPDAEGIERLRDAITTLSASGAKLRLPYYLALLAQLYLKSGQPQEGLTCVERALSQARRRNERLWDAELHRLRGEALSLSGAEKGDVEVALLRAVEIARSQQVKSLELRATISLARLWMNQGRQDEARSRLAGIYDSFTEGFDTPDLQAAQRLLGAS